MCSSLGTDTRLSAPLCVSYPHGLNTASILLALKFLFLAMMVIYVSIWLGHWVPKYVIKHYSGCVWWRSFWMRLTVELVECVKQIVLSVRVCLIQPVQSLIEQKGRVRDNSFCRTVFEAGRAVFSYPWNWAETLGLLGSWACWLSDWKHTMGIPGSQHLWLGLKIHIHVQLVVSSLWAADLEIRLFPNPWLYKLIFYNKYHFIFLSLNMYECMYACTYLFIYLSILYISIYICVYIYTGIYSIGSISLENSD